MGVAVLLPGYLLLTVITASLNLRGENLKWVIL